MKWTTVMGSPRDIPTWTELNIALGEAIGHIQGMRMARSGVRALARKIVLPHGGIGFTEPAKIPLAATRPDP